MINCLKGWLEERVDLSVFEIKLITMDITWTFYIFRV
jgi:hypothetical protein